MKRAPRIGEVGEIRFRVEATHAIDFADERMPAVLSTPWLIWFLEHAAREAMLPLLDEHENTVGVHLAVDHLAATLVGQEVTCRGRVIHVEGSLITFQIEADDPHERVARGLHKLRVIDVARFAQRVRRKS